MENKAAEVYFFDKVDTLTKSRVPIDSEMAALVESLLRKKKVAITTGASYERLMNHVVSRLSLDHEMRSRLFLFPDAGASFFKYESGQDPVRIYSHPLPDAASIAQCLTELIPAVGLPAEERYGKRIDMAESAVTFCGLGENAPHDMKVIWDHDRKKRQMMKTKLDELFPGCDVIIAGTTSLNVTQKGINKSYAVTYLAAYLGIAPEDMLFVGDSFFDDGQDCLVCKTGIVTVPVTGVEETRKFIKNTLAGLGEDHSLETRLHYEAS